MSYLELLKFASPEAIVTLTVLAVLAIGLATRRNVVTATIATEEIQANPRDGSSPTICSLVALLGLIAAACAVLLLPSPMTLFHGMLTITPLNSLFKVICIALAFFAVILASGPDAPSNYAEYVAIILLATIGLMLLVGSEELLVIFIGLELTGLALYILTGFDKADIRSAEAALKYFLFGSTASAFTLFGLSFIYGMTGTTGLAAIANRLSPVSGSPLLFAGIVMTLVGFAFKIAAAPFHVWAPDTYEGAPAPSAAFIASGSKVAAFVVLGKIMLVAFAPAAGSAAWHGLVGGWTPVLAVLAALSILVGNLAALVQKNVRRLLAYSAVAHAGYTLLGIVAGGRDGFSATLFYTTVYAFTLVGAFGVVGLVRRQTGGDDLQNFAALRTRSTVLAWTMTIFMLSLAGLPPLAGFFGKFYLFSAAFRAGDNHGLLWLVAIALFGSFVSLYYYLMVLKAIFVDQGADTAVMKLGLLQKASISLLGGFVLILGLIPAPLVARIAAALS